MKSSTRYLVSSLFLLAALGWLGGCSRNDKDKTKDPEGAKGSAKHEHLKGQPHEHDDKPLTEKDVTLPDSFKAGVSRLEELHRKINQKIEKGELDTIHRVAEEMKLDAIHMKKLASKEVAEDQQVEVGRLCNEIAASFEPIDTAGDAGKKAEVVDIHQKMGKAIEKLKAIAK